MSVVRWSIINLHNWSWAWLKHQFHGLENHHFLIWEIIMNSPRYLTVGFMKISPKNDWCSLDVHVFFGVPGSFLSHQHAIHGSLGLGNSETGTIRTGFVGLMKAEAWKRSVHSKLHRWTVHKLRELRDGFIAKDSKKKPETQTHKRKSARFFAGAGLPAKGLCCKTQIDWFERWVKAAYAANQHIYFTMAMMGNHTTTMKSPSFAVLGW